MKNVLKLIAIGLVGTFIFASCNKGSDFDYEKLQEEQRIKDSIENARVQKHIKDQAPALKAYATANFTNPILDTASGIWYDVITEGDQSSYTYRFSQQGIVAPEVTVKYKGQLLNGTVFDQTEADKSTTMSLGRAIFAWQRMFVPKSISVNNQDYPTNMGVTPKGLKKNSKVKFVTPSPWAYDETEIKKEGKPTIPANSPLVFEIEVVDIR